MTEIEDGVVTDYRGLFRGSTNLGLLLGAFSLEWTKSAPFVSDFTPELSEGQELSVSSRENSLTLGARGEGQAFVHRTARFMEKHGVGEDCLKQYLVRAAFVEYQNIFFSMEIRPDSDVRFTYVLRRRQPLDVSVAMLVDAGVSSEGLAVLRDAARVLQKETVHGYLVSLGTSGSEYQIPFFSQPKDVGSWSRLEELAKLCELNDAFARFEASETLRNALSFAGPAYAIGELEPAMMLMFRDVPETELQYLDLDEAAASRVESLLRICGRKNLTAIQLFMSSSGPPEIKFVCA